jgi:hypothetical protein
MFTRRKLLGKCLPGQSRGRWIGTPCAFLTGRATSRWLAGLFAVNHPGDAELID